ncbi:MAG: SH3-like domain-containing protein [Pseudomonadota bacterium]
MTSPRFFVGQAVRIAKRQPSVHHRVPAYAKGARGVVERVCGEHGQPERFIRGDGAPATRLYRVRLDQRELWDNYQGSTDDCLDIEIFEHWLEPA